MLPHKSMVPKLLQNPIHAVYFISMNKHHFSAEQQRFFARVAHWVPRLFERCKVGTAEMRIGKRRLPDGRVVEVCITCRTIEGGEPTGYRYGDHLGGGSGD